VRLVEVESKSEPEPVLTPLLRGRLVKTVMALLRKLKFAMTHPAHSRVGKNSSA